MFEVDEDRALATLELAWADGGYHGFSADGGLWSAIDLPTAHPGLGQGTAQQDDHLGMRGAELIQPGHLILLVRH